MQELLVLVAQGEAARAGLQQQTEQLQRSTEPLYQHLAELEGRVAKMGWELEAANTCISDLKVSWLWGASFCR